MFQFQFEYNFEDMMASSQVGAKTYRRIQVLAYRIIVGLLALAYLALGAFLFSKGREGLGLILIAIGVFFTAIVLFHHRGTAWRMKRTLMKRDGGATVTLEEENTRCQDEKGEGIFPYSVAIGGYHYKERYFLFADERHAMILPERGLIQGDRAHLRAFLEEKLGKKIVELQ